MKPISPHDPRNDEFDDLIAAALHGELTPEERAQFETRISNDPAAQAANQEAQAMHDLLEKNYQAAQPDPAFEQRMVSGVRRKIKDNDRPHETARESLLALWIGLKTFFAVKREPSPLWRYARTAVFVIAVAAVLAGVALGPITRGIKKSPQSAALQADWNYEMKTGEVEGGKDLKKEARVARIDYGSPISTSASPPAPIAMNQPAQKSKETGMPNAMPVAAPAALATMDQQFKARNEAQMIVTGSTMQAEQQAASSPLSAKRGYTSIAVIDSAQNQNGAGMPSSAPEAPAAVAATASTVPTTTSDGIAPAGLPTLVASGPAPDNTSVPPADTRKLIRNAQLDLEVKSFQSAVDEIAALTKAAGGYVDTSHSQKGGNGKLQGTIVVKVLPQSLDGFLLKLRGLGQLANQSVSTDDVTKDYFDTQARLDNSRRMETQLQDLLKHANSKVSDLLQVERELGRVRGDIEQMQGQLKLYDFQVQYATVTMQVREKDLNQAAAYLLKEQDDFSLFATDVEGTFQKARQAADGFKTQVLVANLVHNSGSDVAAELTVMVAPDQIEPFLAQVRLLGRVANFTRQTQRVAKDGGDSDQPADQTLTEKDKVQVHLSIRSDDETRKQVALTVVAKAVDDALDQAKTAALANAGVEILNSSLNKTPQGQSTAQLTVRVPGKDYATLIAAFNALGRSASLSIERNDNSGPGANGDDAPVIIALSLTDDDTPLQETEMSVVATDVDHQAQEIKKGAATSGVEVKASSFERQPDGTELAQMTFRLPLSKYPAFVESIKNLGKVESLSVRRDDRPDQTRSDDNAPAEISLQLHNQGQIVPDNRGVWTTLRQTFGEGAAALFGSVRVIGVVVAFLVPWILTLILLAWTGRRIYIWRKR